jgi:AcrR family transcriptional regulator
MNMTKKEQIEQTATELFMKHGFKKITVEEICSKAKVSRKTYYTYFDNKNALVLNILEKMTSEMISTYKNLINNDSKSFSEKIRELLKIKFEANKKFSMEFVSDFFHPDAGEILIFFQNIVNESLRLTKDFFEKAQKKGEMNPTLNIDFVLWNMQKQMEICSTPEALSMFEDVQSMTRQLSELIIYGIVQPEQ